MAASAAIRAALQGFDGHATLVRAPLALRAGVDVFTPLDPALQRLTRDLKASLDPRGLFNAGRMYPGL